MRNEMAGTAPAQGDDRPCVGQYIQQKLADQTGTGIGRRVRAGCRGVMMGLSRHEPPCHGLPWPRVREQAGLTGYMRDWLERPGEPASDLDLVVLLLNSLDLLADPPDRLADLSWLREVLAAVGRDDIGGALTAGDLAGLRRLRESLRAVFLATSPAEAASLLNPMLVDAPAVPQLVASGAGLRLQVAPRARGLAALSARLPAALAEHIAQRGIGRLGTCAASPCRPEYSSCTGSGRSTATGPSFSPKRSSSPPRAPCPCCRRGSSPGRWGPAGSGGM